MSWSMPGIQGQHCHKNYKEMILVFLESFPTPTFLINHHEGQVQNLSCSLETNLPACALLFSLDVDAGTTQRQGSVPAAGL